MIQYLEAIGCSRIEGVPTLQLNMESCRWVVEDQPGKFCEISFMIHFDVDK